jgi:hypothetical protein
VTSFRDDGDELSGFVTIGKGVQRETTLGCEGEDL